MSIELPDDLLQRSPEEATRRLARLYFAQARAGVARLPDAGDLEALHDFRVAARRLRSCLRNWRKALGKTVRTKERKALGQLQRTTNNARDAEVALEWLRGLGAGMGREELYGLAWFQRRYERRYSEGIVRIRERVPEDFERLDRGLGQRLDLIQVELLILDEGEHKTFAQALAQRVREHEEDLLRSAERVRSVEDEDEVHRLRIIAKRLRYLLEPLREHIRGASEFVKQAKKLQDVLGDLTDAYVLGEEISLTLGTRLLEEPESEEHDPRPGLMAIARKNQERRDASYTAFMQEWLGEVETGAGRFETLLQQARDIVDELENQAEPGIEIERKYLLKAVPEGMDEWKREVIEQGWLPGNTLQERIRRKHKDGKDHYTRTVKVGSGLRRIEIEEEASAELFAVLWPLTEGCRVHKVRYKAPENPPGQEWLVDVFEDRDLVLCEVEMVSEDIVAEMPERIRAVLDREVTESGDYVNRNLAR
jgi:CHAD domain-containing protein/CYTH domain-containing protein